MFFASSKVIKPSLTANSSTDVCCFSACFANSAARRYPIFLLSNVASEGLYLRLFSQIFLFAEIPSMHLCWNIGRKFFNNCSEESIL